MARPRKTGLDYFPFDVNLLSDEKLVGPRMKHGMLAPMIYISLLRILYGDKGYYIDYRDKKSVIWKVLQDLQGPHQPAPEKVDRVISDLVDGQLFDAAQFKSGTITSTRSQETYYSATVDRKSVTVDESRWILSPDEMKTLSERHSLYALFCSSVDIRPINTVNRPINGVNRPINPQSKVKESKVKNINKYISLKVNSSTRESNCGESDPPEEPKSFTAPVLPFDENSPVMDRVREVVKTPEVVGAIQEFILERFDAGQRISEISIGHHLRDLLEITDDPVEQKRVVDRAVKSGWKAFFPPPKDKGSESGFREPARLCEKPTQGRVYDTRPIDPDFDPTQIEF